jgi:hypothetical protein
VARSPVKSPHALALALLATALACGESEPTPLAEPSGEGTEAGAAGLDRPTFEQNFVFADVSGDSVFLVPWLIRTTSLPEGVRREARGWLARSGTWDAFYAEEWMTPPSRAPARFLPFGNLQLLVQEGDIVDGIIFDDGARNLELVLGEVQSSWGGPRGETVEIIDGAAYLAEERVDGIIMHLARASAGAGPPGGDWALLMSGDSVSVVLSADSEHGGEEEPLYRGWADLDGSGLQWPELHLEWTATQAFPPARRDVPASWRLWSDNGTLDGELHAISSTIQPGSGPGPLLPVRALFEVVGEISTTEGDFPIHGLLVHERR